MDLTARREAVLAEHRAVEKHDPYHQALAAKGDRISERPVAFLCDDEIVIVGPCVPKVLAGLAAFVARGDEYGERATREPSLAQALAKARRLLDGPAPAEVRVPQQTWNALLFGLNEAGVKVALSDGTYPAEG